jgi:UDP-arabinose 4-epimerase
MGIPVVVVDDLSTGHRDAVTVPLIVQDIADREQLTKVFRTHRPRSVMHFAGKAYVADSIGDPATYYHGNVVATLALLDVMRACDCREIVFSSTCASYGIPEAVPVTEDTPQRPISPYGCSKLHIEQILRDYSQAYGLRVAILRYFNAAGAAPDAGLGERHDPEPHLIPRVLDAASGGVEAVTVNGTDYPTPDGSCVRDFIHVVDLARAHSLALAYLQRERRDVCCNLGSGRGHSVLEVVEAVRRVTGEPVAIQLALRREGDPPALVADAARAADLLGWHPVRSTIDQIVGDAWRFRQQQAAPARGSRVLEGRRARRGLSRAGAGHADGEPGEFSHR